MKKIVIAASLLFALGKAQANPELGEHFNEYNEQSKIVVNYDDVNQLLSMAVLETGMSDRKVMELSNSSNRTGTKLRSNRGRKTAYEANRFLFKQVKNSELEPLIGRMRIDLQSLPDQVDLRELGKDEQLAYWLNLYTVGALEKLVANYPKYDLEDEILDDDNYFEEKFITITGQNISLNDIKNHIVFKNHGNNPVVLYGFYQGNIGSPSINPMAYTSENVFKSLGYLAREFINSNRGVIPGRGDSVKVSMFYEQNMALFNNDMEKLRKHLLDYAKYDIKGPLTVAEELDFDIEAWSMADLDGSLREFGGNISTNNAALLNAVVGLNKDDKNIMAFGEGEFGGGEAANLGYLSSQMQDGYVNFGRFSPEMAEYLSKMKGKYKVREGKVEIKDLADKVDEDKKNQ
ncbi:hypothetical protein PALB_14630 [Pseudoalteromonas luteoviolacea B = ATCC 29581]|nr:hypothetical protein PALB_14630 [Pseudoalteromonas luteoviolacea B = ATCC 29581]